MKLNVNNTKIALSEVIDPDLKKDLVSLNMIQNIEIHEDKLAFDVVLTTPACPLKEIIKADCVKAISKHFGEISLHINMTSNVSSTKSEEEILPDVKNIIAISSGKGGVGKSTVATNLAIAMAKTGAKVGLLDADIFGPSIPTMLNCEFEYPQMIQKEGKNLIVPLEQYGIKFISIGLLTKKEDAVVWRGPMASSALRQFINDVQWGELDYLFVDLPPGTSDIHLTLVQTASITGAVVVTTPQKVALDDAQKGIAMFKQPQINVPILGIVENMSWFSPPELPDHKYYLFGKDGGKQLAEKNEAELLGQIPFEQKVREGGDSGLPVFLKESEIKEVFCNIVAKLAQQIAIRNARMEKTKKVELTT